MRNAPAPARYKQLRARLLAEWFYWAGRDHVHAYDFTEYLRRRQKNIADLSEEEIRFLPQISASDAIERVLLHSVRPAEVEHLTPGNPAWERYLERKQRKQGKLD